MKSIRNRASLFAATSMALAFATPALAQETGAPAVASDDDESIVITARRREELLQDVPISVTVYNQEQLTDRNIVTPNDLATYVPSLTVNQRFGPEKSSFVIRGFTQESATSPSVGVYFADVVAPRAQTGTTSGNGVGAGALFDLQNVQVLKGPQGTLFGRNTTGGAILLVPRKPTGELEGHVEFSAGDYNLMRIQGVINIPVTDTIKVRLGIDRNVRDGYMKNHSGIGPDSYNDVNYFAFRASVVADLTPELENYTIFSYNNSFSNGYASHIGLCLRNGIVPAAPNRPAFALSGGQARTAQAACDQIARQNARGDGPLDVEINNPDAYLRIRQWQFINTTTWDVGDSLTIRNIASYAEFREASSFALNGDNFFVPNPPPTGVSAALVGTRFHQTLLNPAPGEDNASQSTMTEELQFQGTAAGGNLTWQAGAYLEISKPLGWSAGYTFGQVNCTDPQNLVCTTPFPGIGNIAHSMTKTYWNNKALYAQATYDFTEQLSLTAGFRYTIDRVRGVGETTRIRYGLAGGPSRICNDTLRFNVPDGPDTGTAPDPLVVTNGAPCHNEFRQKAKKPTWLIDLDYKPTDDILVYAKWARGYRQGGVNMTNIGLETWNPEKVEAYEIGAKTSFRGGGFRGHFNIAAFYNDFSNQQIVANLIAKADQAIAGGQAVVNAGKSKIQGIEIDASVTLFDNLRLDLGYTFLKTELKDFDPPTLDANSPFLTVIPTALVGEPLSFSPKHRLTASLTYTLPLDESVGKISAGVTFVHTSKQFATRADDNITWSVVGQPCASNPSVAANNPVLPPTCGVPSTDVFGFNPGQLPKSNLINLNVNWDNVMGQPIDAAFFITNLTNEIYEVGVGSSLTSNGFENFLYAAPRMWGVRLRYNFGG